MTLQVIGAGFGRTGTNSLKLALEMLGFAPCHHMFEIRDRPELLPFWQAAARGETMNWDQVFAGYRASVDWPSAYYWRELAEHFSDAKIILSVRPADGWFKSVHATIYPRMMSYPQQEPGPQRDRLEMGHEIVVQGTFGGKLDDREHAIGVFKDHIAEVQRTISLERLLTYEVGTGWEPLCTFLNVPVPEAPYPRRNSPEEFEAWTQAHTN